MIFETERLQLIPLSVDQLIMLRDDIERFEEYHNCTYKGEELEGFMKEYLSEQIRLISENEALTMYISFWLLMRKPDRVVVGSAAFKGLPNEDGEIEIGYGLGKEFEHNGYMTEAVKRMCQWGLEQEGVKHIIAETDIDGYASQRILERIGFKKFNTTNEGCMWRL